MDDEGDIIVNAPPKFFNLGEPFADRVNLRRAIITEKADGYLISVTNSSKYGLIVASRGSFDNKYVDAFYLALGETIVVEDYSTAQKLIGKYRLVTLSGEVFEKSGSITGGSRKRSGIQFSQNQDEELERYTKKLEEIDITTNKNMLPGDTLKPNKTSGLRIGFAAVTTRGSSKDDAKAIAKLIHNYLGDKISKADAKKAVKKITSSWKLIQEI